MVGNDKVNKVAIMSIMLTKKKNVYNYSEPYIIAEIGANHNGDMNIAKRLIDSAKEAGVDAVKFQSWQPGSINSLENYNRHQVYNDSLKKHFGSLWEMDVAYHLTFEQHQMLKDYCTSIQLDFCSTPFSSEEAKLLNELNVPFFKIASMDINNYQLLRLVASFGKPIIMSTGMSTISEIGNAVQVIESEGNKDIVLLHCISIYPPDYLDINLNNIPMLMTAFPYPIGFSDHSLGTAIPLASVALGACVIEKHFTLDKNLEGWDHAISADRIEMEYIVNESKNINKALGNSDRFVSRAELEKIKEFRRSIVTTHALRAGEMIKLEDLTAKRPGTGISPAEMQYVIGRLMSKDIGEDEIVSWNDLV